MIYQFRDKKKIEKRKRLIRTIIGAAVFILICVTGILAWSGKLFNYVGRPIWTAQNAVTKSAQGMTSFVRTKASVFHENERLMQENADLKNSMIDYNLVKNENADLKELLGRLPANHSFILGNILAKPNRSPYDTIIIDAGTNVGIAEGQLVFANATMPIGEISRVYSDTSLVMLYSNPGQTTEGVLEGSNASVELLGRGGGNFEMTIPIELSSPNGAMVMIPGNSSEILALVEDIISSPNDPVKKVLLRSPINIQGLKWVQVRK